jgi:hypothetical protein
VNQYVYTVLILDAWEAHSKAITQMHFEEDARLLISAGKDRSIKV